jgi:hypothetical protein
MIAFRRLADFVLFSSNEIARKSGMMIAILFCLFLPLP